MGKSTVSSIFRKNNFKVWDADSEVHTLYKKGKEGYKSIVSIYPELKDRVEINRKKVFYLLKEDGRAGFLDFNHSRKNSISNLFQKIYLRLVVVPVSRIFNLSQEYAYIENSIKFFPQGERLVSFAREVGFKNVEYKTIFCGQMGILILRK